MTLRDPACTLCPLHKGVKSVCIDGDGSLASPVLVLGGFPKEYEDRLGQAYVGRAGQFFRAALRALELYDKVRVDYAIRCRPENNRKPTPEEKEACRLYLHRTIEAMPNLKVIVGMGKVACDTLGWRGQLLKQAGTPFAFTHKDKSYQFVPVVDPEYITENLPYAGTWEEHWRTVRGLLEPVDLAQVTEMIGWRTGTMPGEGPLALDIEATHLGMDHASILCYSVSDGDHTESFGVEGAADLRRLRDLFAGDRPLIVHNAGYEGRCAEALLGVRPRRVVDTLLLAARVNPWQSRSLAALTAKHLPEIAGFKAETDALTARGMTYWELPKDILLKRNALDAWATARLHRVLTSSLPPEALAYAEEDAQLAMFVARMEAKGLWMDEEEMVRLRAEAELAKEQAVASLRQLTGKDINPGSNQQVGEALASLGVRLKESVAGNPVADEAALKSIRSKDPKVQEAVSAILSYRGAVKLCGTYIKGYGIRRDGDGYIRSSIRWPGTVSWRPTSSGPNILNVPRGAFRRVFRAPSPDQVVVEGDLGQFQFRAVAVLTQDPEMMAAIAEGDPHNRTARFYFGDSYSKDQRHHAKTCNFLLIFEGGPETLRREFTKQDTPISKDTAHKYHDGFHTLYSRVKPYWRNLYMEAERGKPVTCPTGGYFWKLEDALQASGGMYEEALGTIGNAQVQAVESRITLRAGLRLEGEGYDIRLCTYDGLLGYGSRAIGLDLARRVRYTIEDECQKEPWMQGKPFPAAAKVGDSWGELKEVE